MIPQQKSKSEIKMTLEEEANWFSLLNGLKFINNKEQEIGIELDEKDIDCRTLINYIGSVSGDIQMFLREKGGVPFKYSLDPNHEESSDIKDIIFTD